LITTPTSIATTTPAASPTGQAGVRPQERTTTAVLFDLDGTLVDSLQGIGATVDAVLAALGRPPCDKAALRRLVGAPLEAIFGALLPDATAQDCIAHADAYRARYWTSGVPHTPLFPGVADVLAACRAAGLPLAVVTTKRVDVATHLLEARGIAPLFSAVIGGDSTPHHKPHPAPALAALGALGIEPARASEVAVVGDTTFDIEMARAAGCRAIGVAWGYGGAETLEAAGAHYLAEAAAHLRALLLDG
jgi:phosphoglycolate phosphatase